MFKSIFADEMEAYLALKTFSVSDPVVSLTKRALSSLDQYLAEIDFPQKELTEDILTPWISSIPGKSKTINEKVGAVRGFVKYLDSLGIPAFLPESPKVKSEYIPYIYSEAEIQKIMHYADNLSPRKPGSCSPFLQLKIPMALRILYGCGTRLGETMALQRKDVYQCSSSDRIDVSDHNECHVMLCSVFTKCDHLHRNQLSVIGSGNPGSGTVLHTAGS